jgi:hypothetical protein
MKLFLMISFFSFIGISCHSDSSYKATMNVIDEYSRILKQEKGIICSSYGLDYAGPDKIYDGKIHTIALGYRIDKNIKFDEARKLFYEIADGLLERLNKNEKIRNYLFHHPVTYRDLEFHLSFDYESKGFLKRDEVDSIHINENRITYFIVDKEEPQKTNTSKGVSTEYFMDYFTKHRSITNKLPEKN